jgi:hypothetical protein
MTVPWSEIQDVKNKPLNIPVYQQSVTCCRSPSLGRISETNSSFNPEYNNLHSKTVRDLAVGFLGSILLRRENDIPRTEKKVVSGIFSFLYCEITLNKFGELIVQLIGYILIHYFNFEKDISKWSLSKILIRTTGKHRKSVRKASCFGMSYLDQFQKICEICLL